MAAQGLCTIWALHQLQGDAQDLVRPAERSGNTSEKPELGLFPTVLCCWGWTPMAKLRHLKIIQRETGILISQKRGGHDMWMPHSPAGPAPRERVTPQTQSSWPGKGLEVCFKSFLSHQLFEPVFPSTKCCQRNPYSVKLENVRKGPPRAGECWRHDGYFGPLGWPMGLPQLSVALSPLRKEGIPPSRPVDQPSTASSS